MKKLFVFLLTIVHFNVFSQISKGGFMIGGSMTGSYNNERTESSASTQKFKFLSFTMNPTIGYFVVDGLAIGASLPISAGKFVDFSSSYSIGIAPLIRYYTPFGVFAHISSGYSFERRKFFNEPLKYNTGVFGFQTGLGYAFFVNSNVSIEPALNYSFDKSDYKSTLDYDEYNHEKTSSSFFFSLGLQYFL